MSYGLFGGVGWCGLAVVCACLWVRGSLCCFMLCLEGMNERGDVVGNEVLCEDLNTFKFQRYILFQRIACWLEEMHLFLGARCL